MRAKEFLKQLEKIDKLIANKTIELDRWKAIATGTGCRFGSERVQTGINKDKTADAVCRYVDIEDEINASIDLLIDKRNEVLRVIEQLNTTEYDLLHKIYVQYKTFYDVADEYQKSYSWVTTVHGTALKNVQQILDRAENKEELL